MLAKAAMRYETKAEECASYEEDEEQEEQEEKVDEDGKQEDDRKHEEDVAGPKVDFTIEGVPKAVVDKFLVYTKRFESQADALAALMKDVPSVGGSDDAADTARPAKM